ncbi:unnamed protein product [Toxocara canis]|uniref:Reverse transcriptase n=1 Tax=Toxocara canis TaxID=6265 RepID=A0A183VER8_TOXCA|nr:unnamed protein product [Toxocara canis]
MAKEERCMFTVITGYCDGLVAARAPSIGNYALEMQNSFRQELVDFCGKMQMRSCITFFKKRHCKKWNWRSPNEEMKSRMYKTVLYRYYVRHSILGKSLYRSALQQPHSTKSEATYASIVQEIIVAAQTATTTRHKTHLTEKIIARRTTKGEAGCTLSDDNGTQRTKNADQKDVRGSLPEISENNETTYSHRDAKTSEEKLVA